MGFLDDAKDKLTKALDDHEDKTDDRTGDEAPDDLTGRAGEGLTQPGPPTDPNNPTG